MDFMINKALIKKIRIEKAWSQEDLAATSGLSQRTVQRIESSGNCSLDSKRAIAAAFDINASDLDIENKNKLINSNIFRFYNWTKTVSLFLIVPILIATAFFAMTNFQGIAEYEVVISNPGDISRDTLKVNLSQSTTSIIELRNGYSLEVDNIPGLKPRLKAQLFHSDEQGKQLLHTSNRIGTDFKPVKYVVCSEEKVIFISPNEGLSSECENT